MATAFTVYSVGFACASVCTDLAIEEATARLNLEHPTGLDHGWTLSKDETFADGTPVPARCNSNPAGCRKHYLFNC